MTLQTPQLPLSFGTRAHDVLTGGTPEELGARTAQLGVRRLQLALMKSYPHLSGARQVNAGLGAQFRSALAAHGVSVAVLSCYVNLIHPDARERSALLDTFRAYLRCAPAFGARFVVSETGSVLAGLGFTPDNWTTRAYGDVVESVAQLCDHAGCMGVIVGIEPGLNHPIHDIKTTRRLVADVASPNLGIVLDPFNLLRTEAAGGSAATDPRGYLDLVRAAFDAFGDVIEVVQLKDYVPDPGTPNGLRPVAVGTGHLPGREAAELFAGLKPGIDVILEGTVGPEIPAALAALGVA